MLSNDTINILKKIPFSKSLYHTYSHLSRNVSEIKYIMTHAPKDRFCGYYISNYIQCEKHHPGLKGWEYLDYKFYNLSFDEQNTYLIESEYHPLVKKINEKIYGYFRDKKLFLERYSKYIHRDWISTKGINYEMFENFCKKNTKFISKPYNMYSGYGVTLHQVSGDKDIIQYYNTFKDKDYIFEEVLTSHPILSEIHPESLNTIRVVTISNSSKVEILYAGFRAGIGDLHVDNYDSGGVVCIMDTDSGIISTNAVGPKGEYTKHPDSNIIFKGFQIPNWIDIKNFCINACKDISDYGIIGWDVAILPDGSLEFVEGNSNPGHSWIQLIPKKGYKKTFYDKIREYYGSEYIDSEAM